MRIKCLWNRLFDEHPWFLFSRVFFLDHCRDIIEVIDYYGLRNLVFCTHSINVDCYAEFYNNLVKIDDLTYITRSGDRDIIFTPNLLRDHLKLNPSTFIFVYFLTLTLILLWIPFTLLSMVENGFLPSRTSALLDLELLAIFYNVLVTCILPINTRDLAVIRSSHSFLLYALRG